jgi:hypothetical protein
MHTNEIRTSVAALAATCSLAVTTGALVPAAHAADKQQDSIQKQQQVRNVQAAYE